MNPDNFERAVAEIGELRYGEHRVSNDELGAGVMFIGIQLRRIADALEGRNEN